MIEQKIEQLIEEATRFAKEFKKSSPARQRKLARMLIPSSSMRSKGDHPLINNLIKKKQPKLQETNNFLRSNRDIITNFAKFKKDNRTQNINRLKTALRIPKQEERQKQVDKIRRNDFGFSESLPLLQKNGEIWEKNWERSHADPNAKLIPFKRTTLSPKETIRDRRKNNMGEKWLNNFNGYYKDNPLEKTSNPFTNGIASFKNRKKPELPFDKNLAVSGGGLYTLDSLIRRRNTKTFRNQIYGNLWAHAAPKENSRDIRTSGISDNYNASKFGTYTDRIPWDIPAHAEFKIPIKDRKLYVRAVTPTEFNIQKQDLKNMSDLKIRRVTPNEQRDKGVWLDKEWSVSNPEGYVYYNGNVPGRIANMHATVNQIPSKLNIR